MHIDRNGGIPVYTCPYGFKIRSKEDAKYFVNNVIPNECCLYIETAPMVDYAFEKTKNGISVSQRHKSLRGNLFNPYVEIYLEDKSKEDVAYELAWQLRKYINKEMFG